MSTKPHTATLSEQRRAGFWLGAKVMTTSLVATGTWGLVTGVAMVKSGLDLPLALAMTFLVFAGSAQLTSLPLIATGAPIWLILLAASVVNLRFVIFSAALHPFFRHFSAWRKWLLGYFTTDMGFVLFTTRYQDAPVKGTTEQTWFFIGGAATNWAAWQAGSVAGILMAGVIPTAWSLEYAAVLALLAITVPLARTRPVIVAVIVTAVAAWASQEWPLRLGLLFSLLVGMGTGLLLDEWNRRSTAARISS